MAMQGTSTVSCSDNCRKFNDTWFLEYDTVVHESFDKVVDDPCNKKFQLLQGTMIQ